MSKVNEKKEDTTTIGGRIRLCRKNAALTQEKLAERIGISADSKKISKMEHDRTDPSCWELVKLAEVLHTTTDYILTGKETIQDTNSEFVLTPAEQKFILDLAAKIKSCQNSTPDVRIEPNINPTI